MVYIALCAPDDPNRIEFPYFVDQGKQKPTGPYKLGKGITSQVILLGHSLHLGTQEAILEHCGECGEDDTESYIGVPLKIDEEVVGVLSVQSRQQHAFDESDLRLCSALAASMSSSLESARRFEQTQQRNAELAVINRIQEGLASQQEMEAIYLLIAEELRTIFNSPLVEIAHIDRTRQVLTYPVILLGDQPLGDTPKVKLKDTPGVCVRRVHTGL